MSMRSLESAICAELREVTGIRTIRVKDLQEWSSGKVDPREGEKVYTLPILGINVAVLSSVVEKKPRKKGAA
jgi:hypothetical protein